MMRFFRRHLGHANGPFEPKLGRRFPIGQPYFSLIATGMKNGRPWVEYKLRTAEWYLDTLDELYARKGDFDRLIGEEMALDGYLAAASSAFDAATGGLIEAIETNRCVPAANRTQSHLWNWRMAKRLADDQPAIRLGCRTDVDSALAGWNTAAPGGWLAQFRQLRNRATHQNTLSRAFYRHVGGPAPSPPSRINVPGLGAVDPMPYVHAILPQVRAICDLILADSYTLNP